MVRKIELPAEEVVALYLAGETTVSLAKRFGLSRAPIERVLRGAGAIRTISEDNARRYKTMTAEERQRQASAAHDAVRGKRKANKTVMAVAAAQAGRIRSRHEQAVSDALREIGIEHRPSHQVGRYLIDLALTAEMIAIEIDGGEWHSAPNKRRQDRVKERALRRLGWRIVRFISAALNYPRLCAARVDILRRDPSAWGRNRVIRCRAKQIAGALQHDQSGRFLSR